MLLVKITHPKAPKFGAIVPQMNDLFAHPPVWAEAVAKHLEADIVILEQGP